MMMNDDRAIVLVNHFHLFHVAFGLSFHIMVVVVLVFVFVRRRRW
jgi:hypothetical protein